MSYTIEQLQEQKLMAIQYQLDLIAERITELSAPKEKTIAEIKSSWNNQNNRTLSEAMSNVRNGRTDLWSNMNHWSK